VAAATAATFKGYPPEFRALGRIAGSIHNAPEIKAKGQKQNIKHKTFHT
jgi:hypothetical protein